MALELVRTAKVGRAVLTHLDKSMDYASLSAELPDNVVVGYDGMIALA